MKPKRIIISTIIGKLFKMVETRELIPGIELIVRRGRRILMTRMADTSEFDRARLTQPRTTTAKSNYEKEMGVLVNEMEGYLRHSRGL
jgi:hypothetical protein